MPVVNSTVTFQTEHSTNIPDQFLHTRKRRRCDPNPFKRKMVIHRPSGVVFLCYRDNKIVMLGAKSSAIAISCIEWFLTITGSRLAVLPIIRNLVYIFDSGIKRKLPDLCRNLRNGTCSVWYEPESCPALVMTLEATGATVLIYSSGKITITGLSSSEQVAASVRCVQRHLGCNKVIDADMLWSTVGQSDILHSLSCSRSERMDLPDQLVKQRIVLTPDCVYVLYPLPLVSYCSEDKFVKKVRPLNNILQHLCGNNHLSMKMVTETNHTAIRLIKAVEICEVCGYTGKHVDRHIKVAHNRQPFCRFMSPIDITMIIRNQVTDLTFKP